MSRRKTKEEFIRSALERHGQKYDYSNIEYLDTKTKVEIICQIHGKFSQLPSNHLKGQGCPSCGRLAGNSKQRYSKIDFLESVGKGHGDKYDYSQVSYLNSQTKVKIICPEHGAFMMKPNSHFNGQGCPECGRLSAKKNIALSFSEFLNRAIDTHGDRYQYLEDSYQNYTTKMSMFCSEHGLFNQTPHSHISMNAGCPKCGIRQTNKANEKGWEIVLDMFISVHADRYEYDESSYSNTVSKMKIKCSKHGWFEQKPYQHYGGSGCGSCAYEELGESKRITLEEFIELANTVHPDRYDYSSVEYLDIHTPVEILCSKHGGFMQIPRDHYRGSGCPKCKSSRGENLVRQILQDEKIDFEEQKTFDELTYKSKLKCDFYLPSFNTVIEFNGLQHYQAVSLFGGEEALKATQKRDLIKYSFLKEKNIRLVIVRYDVEDVRAYLEQKLEMK